MIFGWSLSLFFSNNFIPNDTVCKNTLLTWNFEQIKIDIIADSDYNYRIIARQLSTTHTNVWVKTWYNSSDNHRIVTIFIGHNIIPWLPWLNTNSCFRNFFPSNNLSIYLNLNVLKNWVNFYSILDSINDHNYHKTILSKAWPVVFVLDRR